MTLAALFVLAELADLATYLQAPHLESNPAMQGWPPTVVAAKFIALTAVAALALIGLTGRKQTFTLGVCLAIAAFSAGTNAHALRAIDAAPTSATQPAPVTSGGTGNEQGTPAPAAESRTPAPTLRRRQPELVPMGHETKGAHPGASPATFRGRASWYGAGGLVAAAGPELRRRLGRRWRGRVVDVCAGRCVRVELTDWCYCRVGGSERLLDLSDDAFSRLAPLSTGLVRVRVLP